MVEGVLWCESNQSVTLVRSQDGLLVEGRRVFGHLFNLGEVELVDLWLELGQVIDTSCILWRNVVDLGQVFLHNDSVIDVRHHLGGVGVQVLALLVGHNTKVELARLVVFAELALVVVVTLAGDDIVGDLVGCLCNIGAELVGERVGVVLLVACMVSIHTHCAIEVDRGVRPSHEGTIGGNLVQVDTDAVVLSISVEEHAELQKRVWRVLDTRDH